MSALPTEEKLLKAIEKLNGKAGGESSILPEMVKVACIGDEFVKRLVELVHDVWKEKNVPSNWSDANLIPIPKKGDLSHWRGISLLDVIGKVVAKILQERLQKLTEDGLPKSQCGFRKGEAARTRFSLYIS